MSAETKQALDAALTAHVQDELDGGLVTAWMGIAVVIRPEEAGQSTNYFRLGSPQPMHSLMGLAHYLTVSVDELRRANLER